MKNRVNWSNLPPTADGMTMADCKKAYQILYSQREEERRMRRASDNTTRARTKEAREAKTESKTLKRDLQTVTRKQAATDQFRGTAGWSGAAIGVVTVTYTGFETYGFPGPEWLLTHEFVKGGIMWIMTALFAGAAKAYYGAN